MRQALAVALQDYAGAVVLVSHDRHLLNSVADEFILVSDGKAQRFDGDLEDYARWLASGAKATETPAAPVAVPPAAIKPAATVASAAARKQQRRTGADQRARLAPLRTAVEKAEQALSALAATRAEVETNLADTDLYLAAGKDRLQDLLARQAQLQKQMAAAEAAWVAATEQLETATLAVGNQ
jgi:ATP-binding cassette subfamily F protein 3